MNKKKHTDRIQAIVKEVKTEDDSGVHLDFCFTGYYPYQSNFICAVWPKHPNRAEFNLAQREEYGPLFRRTPNHNHPLFLEPPEGYPLGVDLYWGRDLQHHQGYLFMGEDPHEQHRPYFWTRYDDLFERYGQDDGAIISHHAPKLIQEWREKRDIVNGLVKSKMTVEKMILLSSCLDFFDPEKRIKDSERDKSNSTQTD